MVLPRKEPAIVGNDSIFTPLVNQPKQVAQHFIAAGRFRALMGTQLGHTLKNGFR